MSLLLRGYTVTAEQVAEASEVEVEEDPLDRELDRIRQRRTGQRRFFRGTFDDWTLAVGVISGIVFFGGMMVLSSGIIAADSIVLDQTLSKTPIDPGGECQDQKGEVWIRAYGDHDNLVVKSNNAPSSATILVVLLTLDEDSDPLISSYQGGIEDIRSEIEIGDSISEGNYLMSATLFFSESEDSFEHIDNESSFLLVSESLTILNSKQLPVEVKTVKKGGLFNSEESVEVVVTDDEPRTCLSIQDFGTMGWLLMLSLIHI